MTGSCGQFDVYQKRAEWFGNFRHPEFRFEVTWNNPGIQLCNVAKKSRIEWLLSWQTDEIENWLDIIFKFPSRFQVPISFTPLFIWNSCQRLDSTFDFFYLQLALNTSTPFIVPIFSADNQHFQNNLFLTFQLTARWSWSRLKALPKNGRFVLGAPSRKSFLSSPSFLGNRKETISKQTNIPNNGATTCLFSPNCNELPWLMRNQKDIFISDVAFFLQLCDIHKSSDRPSQNHLTSVLFLLLPSSNSSCKNSSTPTETLIG